MIITFFVSLDSDLNEVLVKLSENYIEVINYSLTEHGNHRLTVIADSLSEVELISSIYFD